MKVKRFSLLSTLCGGKDVVKDKSRKSVPLLKLLKFASTSDKLLIIIGTVGAIISGLSWPVMTIVFGDIIDIFVNYEYGLHHTSTINNVTYDEFMSRTYNLSGYLLLIAIVSFIGNFLLATCFTRAAINQINTIKVKYFESVLRQEISWLESKQTGDFASRISADLKRIGDGIGKELGFVLYDISSSLFYLITAFIYGWELSLVILIITPFLAVSTGVMAKVQATFARKVADSYAMAGNVAEEVISSIRTVYSFGGEVKEVNRYEKNLIPALKCGIKRNFLTGLGTGLMWLCVYSGLALGIWYGIKLVIRSEEHQDDKYTIGRLYIVFWNMTGCGWNFGDLAPYLETIQIAKGTARTVFDIIDRKPLIDISDKSGDIIKTIEMNIEFKNIHFSYPLRPEVKIFNDFNLTIKAGETVALVGPSGAGKSTLIQLLQRFYDIQSGEVLIDGKDIKQFNIGWIRQQIGVVGQEPVLFHTTIAENISLGSTEKTISNDDIETSAKEANCHQFIEKLPLKYQTLVGDRGTQLSGGQKQRIAIARALISKPKLLLLDEATSALDLQSEHLVQIALDRASKGRTTIIIAHRLSTIINSDRIIYIENGMVIEMGSHCQLMVREGSYYRLVKAHESKPKPLNDFECEQQLSTTVSTDLNSLVAKEVIESKEESEEEILKDFSQMRLFRLLLKDWVFVITGLLCSTLFGLMVPIYALIFGSLVDVFAKSSDHDVLRSASITYALSFVGLGVGACLVATLEISMFGIASERLTMRLRGMAFSSILKQEVDWFDRCENSTGALCARLSSDAANIQGASGSRISVISQTMSTFIASIIFGFLFNWRLCLVTLAFMPLIILAFKYRIKFHTQCSTDEKESTERASKIAIEAISGIQTIVSLNQEKYFLNKYNQVLNNKIGSRKRSSFYDGIALGFSRSLSLFSYSVSFLYGAILVSKGQLGTGDFFK